MMTMMAYLLFGRADDGRKDGLGLIVAGHTGLASAGTIVDDDGGLGHVCKRLRGAGCCSCAGPRAAEA
jgi:hypothetical protein